MSKEQAFIRDRYSFRVKGSEAVAYINKQQELIIQNVIKGFLVDDEITKRTKKYFELLQEINNGETIEGCFALINNEKYTDLWSGKVINYFSQKFNRLEQKYKHNISVQERKKSVKEYEILESVSALFEENVCSSRPACRCTS